MRKLVTALFGLLVAAAPAAAQDYKPVDVNFGFGWAFPSADFKKDFNAGWNGTIGVTFNFNPHLGVQAEYIYAHMDGPDKTIPLSRDARGWRPSPTASSRATIRCTSARSISCITARPGQLESAATSLAGPASTIASSS